MRNASWPRLVIATILLLIGATTGVLAWAIETCVGGKADSLWTGSVTLVANLIAWPLLWRGVTPRIVLFVAALPALAALDYSVATADLAAGFVFDGQSACEQITGDEDVAPDGSEPLYIVLWLLVCASFWGGLAPVLRKALRTYKRRLQDE